MKRIIILTFTLILGLLGYHWLKPQPAPDASALKEGDIVFQTSLSSQSSYIQLATRSPWSHCGIIIEKPDGLYVLEAISTVSLTPYQQWVERGKGKRVVVKRYTDKPVKITYSKYLGKPYDLAFKFGNGKWYCSELVYDIFKRQLDVELCRPRLVSDYALHGVKDVLKKRGINTSQLVIAPSDLYNSKQLNEL